MNTDVIQELVGLKAWSALNLLHKRVVEAKDDKNKLNILYGEMYRRMWHGGILIHSVNAKDGAPGCVYTANHLGLMTMNPEGQFLVYSKRGSK